MPKSINVKIISGTNKKGKEYTALQVIIGEYRALLFPSKIELFYIKDILEEEARNDFKKELEDEFNGDTD